MTASPTDPERAARLDALRRTAFGRAHTPEERAAAAVAHEALARAEADDVTRAAPPIEVAPETAEPDPEPGNDEPRRVGDWRVWMVPALVALVVGALIGVSVTTIVGEPSAAAPSPAPTFTPGSSTRPAGGTPLTTGSSFISGPGSLEAAEKWFSRAQSVDDLNEMFFGDPTSYVADSIRLVQSTESGEVWVAKTPEGGLCLMVTSRGEGAGTCVTGEEFTRGGLTLGHENVQVAWDGVRMAVAYSAP